MAERFPENRTAQRRFGRFSPHQHLHRIWALRIGHRVGRFDWLGGADRAAAQKV
jgi:hypothetical protein